MQPAWLRPPYHSSLQYTDVSNESLVTADSHGPVGSLRRTPQALARRIAPGLVCRSLGVGRPAGPLVRLILVNSPALCHSGQRVGLLQMTTWSSWPKRRPRRKSAHHDDGVLVGIISNVDVLQHLHLEKPPAESHGSPLQKVTLGYEDQAEGPVGDARRTGAVGQAACRPLGHGLVSRWTMVLNHVCTA